MRNKHRLLAVPLALAVILAACGGDDAETESTSAPATTEAAGPATTADAGTVTTDGETPATTAAVEGGDAEGIARAAEFIADFQTPPDAIGPTIPLDSVPEPKTVAWLQCSLPSCAAIGVGFENATAALGWTLEVVTYDTDAAAAFQQALDLGVDYVATTGTSQAVLQDQITAAAEAGIGYFSCFDTSEPQGEANNIWMQCGDATAVTRAGKQLANQIIVDSNGTANVLMVNIPDFAVLVSEREGSEAAYAENCPGCTFTELPLTLDQLLAGEVPGAVVAALQNDPSIDYVHFAFDGLTTGVSTVLADAGLLEGRTLVGVDFSGAVLQEVVDGTMKFWTANPKEYSAWLMVDGMARHSIGQENTEERANALLPTFTVSSPEQAEPLIATDGWPGPDTMADQFKALWGV
jgi:hypothetical protein